MLKSLLPLLLILFTLAADAQPRQERLFWQERPRKFITFVPHDYTPGEELPLVINMHPFLTDGAFQMWYTKFNGIADRERVIVAYPYGIQGRWNSGSFLGIGSDVDDIGFIGALIDYMAVKYNVDTRRVYATGYSAGGYMSYTLACELTNRVAAIAPVAASMNEEVLTNCTPERPIPVMVFNGTADAIVSYNGSVISPGVEDVVELWQVLNGCDAEPNVEEVPNTSTTDNTTSTRFSYNNCDEDSEVILYKIFGGGHTWPGRNFPLLGNTSQDVIANELIWEFFNRHQIPEEIACDKVSGLLADIGGNVASLSWNPVDGADNYSLFYDIPGQSPQLVEDISETFYQIDVPDDGDLLWTVKAECESGHISWATVQNQPITARLAQGRMNIHTYPNPVSDRLHIEFNDDYLPGSIAIINAYGHEVGKYAIPGKSMNIDVSSLRSGVFHLVTDDGSYAAQTIRKW